MCLGKSIYLFANQEIMLDSRIIKIHINDKVELERIGLFVKLLSFESGFCGEEFGDKHELKFEFKKENKIKIIKYGWTDNTHEKHRNFNVFDYNILHLKDSTDVFEKKDKKGDWIKLVVFNQKDVLNVDLDKIRRHYLAIDYANIKM